MNLSLLSRAPSGARFDPFKLLARLYESVIDKLFQIKVFELRR
jgi:hypothetical protein